MFDIVIFCDVNRSLFSSHSLHFLLQGNTSPERETALSVLSKFAPSSGYTQQRLGKKNVATQKVAGNDKEFKCEKNNPIAQKTKKLESKKKKKVNPIRGV